MCSMKSINFILSTGVFILSTFLVKAEIPETPEFKDYANLVERSPFKIKAEKKVEKVAPPEQKPEQKPEPEPEPEPSKDYELRGVTKLEDKWMIVMVDVKEPTKNIIIEQGSGSDSNLKLVDVTQNVDKYELTSATVKVGDQVITINYNKESLAANYKEAKSSSDRRDGDKGRGGDRDRDRDRDKERDRERRERYEMYMKYMKEQRDKK
jgi:hypothetical protein